MEKLASVIGATGQTGKHIVKKLIEQNIPVRVLSRNLSKAKKMFGDRVEIIEGDLVEVRDLKNLVDGITHLFAAHGADNYPGERGYELIDFEGTKKALDSIALNQKPHIIYMSSIYVERKNPPADFPGRPLYWKRRAEHLIQVSGNSYTIVRASWLNNNRGGKLQIKAEQGDQGDGKICREDVAEVMMKSIHFESARGKIFEVYNVEGAAIDNWDNFFSELKSDVIKMIY
jgi:uncharacterized protein YbjT (DUF2867 family)